jgi:hypothetical protein
MAYRTDDRSNDEASLSLRPRLKSVDHLIAPQEARCATRWLDRVVA